MNAEMPAGDEFDEQYVTLYYDKLKRLAYTLCVVIPYNLNTIQVF